MVIFSFNKKRVGKFLAIVVFAVFLIVVCTFISCERREAVAPYATCDEIGQYFTEVSDTKSHAEFLAQFGLKIDKKSKSSEEVLIPGKFNEVYEDYNDLQTKIGLNLTPFKSQEATKTTYKLKNSDNYVTLLIFKGHVIGGHISSGELGEKYKPIGKSYGKTG